MRTQALRGLFLWPTHSSMDSVGGHMGGDIIGNQGLPLGTLGRLREVITTFRGLEPNVPTSYLDAYLAVVLKPGQGPTEYAAMLGSIQAITSRTLLEIGESARSRENPLHLVESRLHPENRRQRQYWLTPKGYALACQIGATLQRR